MFQTETYSNTNLSEHKFIPRQQHCPETGLSIKQICTANMEDTFQDKHLGQECICYP